MRRGLFASAWLASQAFMNAAAFNANIGAWNTARMTRLQSVCAHCHRLRVRRVCLGVGCGAAWPFCRRPRPTAMHAFCRASLICASLIFGVFFACSVVSKLSESAWFGAKAFYYATAFNANIGAWNTARMTTMGYVCALCHRLRVRRVCLGLGCGAAWPFCRRPRPTAMRAFCRASLILPCFTHFWSIFRMLRSK